ncbi:MAG: GDSL-type esterase/lipase family protein [Pseudomonadota bacterium]
MIRLGLLSMLVLAAFGWGLAAGTYKIFPFNQVQAVQDFVSASFASVTNTQTGYRESEAATQRGLAMADWDTRADTVMIGDSITEIAPWKDMFPDADILNRGASGDTVSGVEQRLDLILKAKPTRAFILIGTNDLNLQNPITDVLAIYERVIERLERAGVEVHVQSVPFCEQQFALCTQARRENEAALNAGLKQLADSQGVAFVDLAASFPAGEEYRADGVHPTIAGYKAWRDILRPFIEKTPKAEDSK